MESLVVEPQSLFLPVEITTHIFSFLLHLDTSTIDHSTLASAARVSRSWNPAATALLYHHVDITESKYSLRRNYRTGKLPQLSSLITTLATNPHVAALVCSVSHTFPWSYARDLHTHPSLVYSQILVWREALAGIRQLTSTAAANLISTTSLSIYEPDNELASSLLLHLLPRIHSFSLGRARLKDLSFPVNMTVACWPSLQDLELRDLWLKSFVNYYNARPHNDPGHRTHDEDTNAKLAVLLRASPSIRRLRITPVVDVHKLLRSIRFEYLHTFQLGLDEQFEATVLETVIEFLSMFVSSHAPTLRRLALHNPPQATEKKFRINCPQLQELMINPGYPPRPDTLCELLDQLSGLKRLEVFVPNTSMSYVEFDTTRILDSLRRLRNLESLCIPLPFPDIDALGMFLRELSLCVPGLNQLQVLQNRAEGEITLKVWATLLSPFKRLEILQLGQVGVSIGYQSNGSDDQSRESILNTLATVGKLKEIMVVKQEVTWPWEHMSAIRIVKMQGGELKGVAKRIMTVPECTRVLITTGRNVGWE